MKLVNIGFGNMVSANRMIAIVSPESAPIKRMIQESKDEGNLIDATYGRKTRAVIVTDSGHIILSAIQPETVGNRFNGKEDGVEEEEIEATDVIVGIYNKSLTKNGLYNALIGLDLLKK